MQVPYAKVLMSVNGAATVFGGQVIIGGSTVQLSGESTSHWETQLWEIYDYPEGFALPTGWNNVNGVYQSNSVTPAIINIPANTVKWGKYLFRLTVNGGLLNGVFQGTTSAQPLVYTNSAVHVLSVNGLYDVAWQESSQFDTMRQWVGDLKRTLRILDPFISAVGFSLPLTLQNDAQIIGLLPVNKGGTGLNLASLVGQAGKVITVNVGETGFSFTTGGGIPTPGGNVNEVQFNNSGVFGGALRVKAGTDYLSVGLAASGALVATTGSFRGPQITGFGVNDVQLLSVRNSTNTKDNCALSVWDETGDGLNDYAIFGTNVDADKQFDMTAFFARLGTFVNTTDADGSLAVISSRNFGLLGTSGFPTGTWMKTQYGSGRGVMAFHEATVNPSVNVANSITLYVDAADNYLKYRKENGVIIVLDGSGGGSPTVPGGNVGEIQYNNSGAFGGALRVKTGTDFISIGLGATSGVVASTGHLRLPRIPTYVSNNPIELLNVRNNANSGDLSAVSAFETGGQNWMNLGGSIDDVDVIKQFDVVNFFSALFVGMTVADPDGGLLVVNNRNFALAFTSGASQFGGGRGVFGFYESTVNPSTNPPNGIVLYVDVADNFLKYRKSNGTIIVLDGGGGGAVSAGAVNEIQAADGVGGFLGATNIRASANLLAMGPTSTIAGTGIMRWSNNQQWYGRNAANTADCPIIQWTTFNSVILGGSGTPAAGILAGAGAGIVTDGTVLNIGLPRIGVATPYASEGFASVSLTGGASTLTLSSSQYNKRIIQFTGTLTANITVKFPDVSDVNNGPYEKIVLNGTTGNFTITLDTASGGATVPIVQSGIIIVTDSGVFMISNGNQYSSEGSIEISVTGLSGTLTLTPAQYSKRIIIFTGSLTAALRVNFPNPVSPLYSYEKFIFCAYTNPRDDFDIGVTGGAKADIQGLGNPGFRGLLSFGPGGPPGGSMVSNAIGGNLVDVVTLTVGQVGP